MEKEKLIKTKKITLYVDMDGTVANFYEDSDFLNKMKQKNYFLTLKPFLNVIYALAWLNEIVGEVIEFKTISAKEPSNIHCVEEKNIWLDKYMPFITKENRIFTEPSIPKHKYVDNINENCILIDDYTKNLMEWENAGGHAIKVINNINRKQGKWKGKTMHYDQNISGMILDILEVVLMNEEIIHENK